MKDQRILSIIIPVLNWDLKLLLNVLIKELEDNELEQSVEIIIADDCSDDGYRLNNRKLVKERAYIAYYELEQRIGRAAIRNDLLDRVNTECILFLDADVLPDDPSFLRTYLEFARQDVAVVCGGISYRTRILTAKKYDFYFYKGKQTEWIPARVRRKVPWRYLFTANVLIKRSVLLTVDFNEEFSGYGYEDIEWGIRLENIVDIQHIDNTCSHLGLVGKKESFKRMRQSIDNFNRLRKLHPEVFEQANISRIINLLHWNPAWLLNVLDYLLQGVFLLSRIQSINLLCYQLDKAILLACALKKEEKEF